MLLFLICVGLLIAGYFIYGSFVDRVFGPILGALYGPADLVWIVIGASVRRSAPC